jgi:methanogenic corrinoid protein MtbC1
MKNLIQNTFPLLQEEFKTDLTYLISKISETSNSTIEYQQWLSNYLTYIKINPKQVSNLLNKDILVKNSIFKSAPIKRNSIAKEITNLHILLFSEIERQSSDEFRDYIEQDTEKHIQFLEQAISNESVLLFTEYIIWVNSVLVSLGMSTNTLIRFLISMKIVIAESVLHRGTIYIDASIRLLISGNTVSASSSICFTQTPESKQYLSLLLEKKKNEAKDFIISLIEQGMEIKSIYTDIFQASQYELGRLWELNEISVAQEHYCTAVTNTIISIVASSSNYIKKNGYKAITTCVGSEQHAMGIRIINDFLEMDGWETYYMGANVPTVAVLSAIEDIQPNFIALSVTLTPHIKQLNELISEIKKKNPSLKIMVGGYPFLRDHTLWQKVGADGFASNAWEIGDKAIKLISNEG